MTNVVLERTTSESQGAELPDYVPPTLTVMDQDEVLKAFQMTASEISAAGCWWTAC